MTCGVYIMHFKNTDKVYIGQSRNIEKRTTEHNNLFRLGKASSKLMEAYLAYGLPTIEVLKKCEEKDLNSLEEFYIEEFDSVNNGFNTRSKATSGGVNCYGELNGRSKYTNKQVVNTLLTLIEFPELKHKEVAAITGLSRSMVVDIACGHGHRWLEKDYPIEYSILLNLIGNRSSLKYSPIVSPEGKVYEVTNLSSFCLEHGLDTGNLSKVLRGLRKSYNGWKRR